MAKECREGRGKGGRREGGGEGATEEGGGGWREVQVTYFCQEI